MTKPYFVVSPINEVFVRVTGSEPELEMDLYTHFTYKAIGYQHHPKFKAGIWNGDLKLYLIRDKTMYFGLLDKFDEFCKDRDYDWFLSEDFPIHDQIAHSDSDIDEFLHNLDLPSEMTPRDYQIQGLRIALSTERGILVSPTSSGKSLMMYMITRAISRPTLIIVPTIQLVSQMQKDFVSYSRGTITPQIIMAGKDKIVENDIVISTWQSLQGLDKKWFENFDVLIGDEAHMFQAGALVKIMTKTDKIRWKFGTTGTLSDEKVHKLVLEGLFGPRSTLQTTRELIDRGYATKLKIKCVLFKHPEEKYKTYLKTKKIKTPTYADEIEFIISNEDRNRLVSKIACSLPGNTLVLCMRNGQHAVPLHEMISEMTDKTVHIVTGSIDLEKREHVREAISSGGEHIVVATYGTFKMGINIPKIDNLVFAHPLKAKITTLQSIGRVLRLADGKKIARTIDIGDQLVYTKMKNHTFSHMEQRLRIYDREGFDWTSSEIELKGGLK